MKLYDASILDEPVNQQAVLNNLHDLGPALVSMFMVHKDFQLSEKVVHLGHEVTDPKQIGFHAMVLVGYRKTEAGQDRFLLQSWWKAKPFIEVDAPYLEQRGASLIFVTTVQKQIPDGFQVNIHHHVELEMTILERLPDEM